MNTCTRAVEINFDCLVGPTHHFGGLSLGNLASTSNKSRLSSPKKAALQGLKKMRFLAQRGFLQGILPPHERPHFKSLRNLGFTGGDEHILRSAYHEMPAIFSRLLSSSSMWAANAATISPSADSLDQKLHITPANLVTMLHRSIEPEFATAVFRHIFSDDNRFTVHDPLLHHDLFSDEGAANHNRLTPSHHKKGLQVFVYGKEADLASQKSMLFPSRQSLLANSALIRRHNLDPNFALNIQQNPQAIDKGAFHNDVVCVANERVMFCHELAFANQQNILCEINTRYEKLYEEALTIIQVAQKDLSIDDAVKCYLFNSQLLTKSDGSMLLFAPADCQTNAAAPAVIEGIVADKNPINEVSYFDISESMANGGGPACLRLRIVLTDAELKAISPAVLFSEATFNELEKIIDTYYVDQLELHHFFDSHFLNDAKIALDKIAHVLGFGSIYEFQR